MIKITILLFAHLKEKAGSNRILLEIPVGTTVGELKNILIEQKPALRSQLNKVLVSINQVVVLDDDQLSEDSEVAIFPPVSGGCEQNRNTIIKISDEPLDQNQLVKELAGDTIGAVCTFTGLVRQITTRNTSYITEAIEYEAYQPMAEKQMKKIADEIRERWHTIEGIGIIQRIGKLDAGTPSVLITCTASHRDTGVFEAARYGIDRLKEIVPVWKKENRPDGDRWIEGDYQMQPGDSQ